MTPKLKPETLKPLKPLKTPKTPKTLKNTLPKTLYPRSFVQDWL